MELAPEANGRSVAKAAARRQFGTLLSVTLEVAANPPLALPEEALDLSFRMGPAAAGHWRNRDDQALSGIDRHP
jgi:hypothetical protein